MAAQTQKHEHGLLDLQTHSLDTPDEVKSTAHSKVDFVRIGGKTVTRYTFFPGFHWKSEVGPLMGKDYCPGLHIGAQVQGRMRIDMDNGKKLVLGPGDAFVIPPGHDGVVLGDEPVVCIVVE
jgi:hypothetical protein